MKEIKILVKRYEPEDKRSWISEYKVPVDEDTTVLDALIYIKDRIDRTLTFRYSCRMAICGSCGMVINGKPLLACHTRISEINEPIFIEPLFNFEILKDLVVDIDIFMDYLKEMKPYIIRKEEPKEIIIKTEQQEPIMNPSACINCMLCYAACPVFGYDPTFKGPAALSLLYRYLMDPLDQGKEDRLKIATDKDAIWKCSFWGECSNVCPKGVDPAFSIQRLKLMAALSSLK